MKILSFIFLILATYINVVSQTNLISNGTFESSTTWTNWYSTSVNGDLFGGTGPCSPHQGSKYIWLGSNSGYGFDNAMEDMYQTVTIPSNTTNCYLGFYSSINTSETGATPFDYLKMTIRSTSGALLYSFGSVNNTYGNYGIPGCQSWNFYSFSVPSSYYGSTVRISFEFTTDVSNPTIFRVDDVTLMATLSNPCTYSLSQYSYTCPTSTANLYNNITSVSTQSSCYWSGNVTSGNSWLSTTSSSTGSGNLSISVLQNTSANPRTGTIDINGQSITITQPGSCTYSLSQNTYTCPNANSNTFNSIVTVTTQTSCSWTAIVTSGNTWLSTSSSGGNNGNVSVLVTQNNSGGQRTGTIDIGGQTLTIIQPVGCTYSLSQYTFTCADASANSYNSIILVNTQSACSWAAVVTFGSSWLSSPSAGTNSGAVSITVNANPTTSSRTGAIEINGQYLSIIQPGISCVYSLSNSTYTCTNGLANTYSNIATVTTQSVCPWTANPINGALSWMATSSSGPGNGSLTITVLKNNTGNIRTGNIDIGGSIITIVQPVGNVGIEDNKNNLFSISPNPVQREFIINAADKMIGKGYEIYDNLGRLVSQGRIIGLSTTVIVDDLITGVYFVNIPDEGINLKLLKN